MSSDPTLGLTVGFFGGLWTFFRGFKVFREYKIVEDTPRIAIRSVPMGLVRVRGKAQVDHPVPSPVSHTPCCLYKVEIDQWKVEKGSGSWKHLRTDVDGPKFFLEDGTGKVLIQWQSAELDLPQTTERVVDSARPSSATMASGATDGELLHYVEYSGVHKITGAIEHLLQRTGPLADSGRENARQTLLQGLQPVPMLARGGPPPLDLIEKFVAARPAFADPEKEAMRQAAVAHFREMAAANQLPGELANMGIKQASGRYRLREYVIVPGQEYSVTGSCTENPECQHSHDRNLICRGTNEKTFLISAKTDAEEDGSLRKRSLKMVLGGAGLALACLAMLLLHFHLL
jgi:hypothetical protein